MSLVPPTPLLDETIDEGQFDHISDHEAIAKALNNDTMSLAGDQVVIGAKTYLDGAFLDKGNQVYNVKAYGAVGDGVADDTAAIQDAIDAAIAAGGGVVYLPAGTYKVTATLYFTEFRGLVIRGAGMFLTKIVGAGTFDSLIEGEGVAYCNFEDFGLSVSSGTVTNLMFVHKGAAAIGVTRNTYRNLHAEGDGWVNAFAIGTDGTTAADSQNFHDCYISGAWTAGNTTTSQYGWKFGSGTAGNVVSDFLYGCAAYNVRFPGYWGGAAGGWYGGQVSGCESMASGLVINRTLVLDGVRVEFAERIWQIGSGSGSGAQACVTLRNIEYQALNLAADTHFIDHRIGGALVIDNVVVWDAPAGVEPVVFATTQSTSKLVVNCMALICPTKLENQFDTSGDGTYVTVGAHIEIDNTDWHGVNVATGPHLHKNVSAVDFTGDLEVTDYKQKILAHGPVGYWRLGEPSGTTAADASRNGNNGTYVNTPTLGTDGVIAGDPAATFTAANSERVDLPDMSLFETGDCTYLAWMHKTDANQQSVFSEGNGGGLNGFAALNVVTTGQAVARNDAGTTYTVTGAGTINNDAWHLVALIKDGTTLKLVVDGELSGTPVTIAGTFTIDRARIGDLGRSTEAQHFEGTIDEVAVFDRALSVPELKALYDAGRRAA